MTSESGLIELTGLKTNPVNSDNLVKILVQDNNINNNLKKK